MENSERTLVDGLRANDPASFEEMIRRYAPRLLATATRMLGSAADAEDVVQESLIAAWKSIGRFEGGSSLYTWLHRIAVNGCLARMRSANAKGEVSMAAQDRSIGLAFEGIPAAWSEPGPSLEKRVAMRRAIQRALDLIPSDLRAVLLLRDVEELSSREVADQLGIADAAVRQRLHRARTAMAELLRPELCNGPALTCGGQLDLLFDYIDSALPADLQAPVHGHLESCAPCGDLLTTYRATIGIPKAIAKLTALDAVSEEFVARTVTRTHLK